MKAMSVSEIISRIVTGNKDSNIHNIWHRERMNAAKFGPSHVAEVDAIFSRQV